MADDLTRFASALTGRLIKQEKTVMQILHRAALTPGLVRRVRNMSHCTAGINEIRDFVHVQSRPLIDPG